MILTELSLKNFRNMEILDLKPCKHVNIIYGENAQGKTNLLEAIWLLTGAKSFRGAKDNQLIMLEKDFAEIKAKFFSQGREQESSISIGRNQKRKKVTLNQIDQESCANLSGVFAAVVFSPSHLSLVKDGPAFRRKFLDTLLCQISRVYLKNLIAYQRILEQRNALLKSDDAFSDQLDIWDLRLCATGSKIIRERLKLVASLLPGAQEIYTGISGGREAFSFSYACSVTKESALPEEELQAAFLRKLKETRKSDYQLRTTQTGPHRDDLDFSIDGLDVKIYGSQGQQRSCVLTLKLAECRILEELLEEKPVVLLDDVLSELDSLRQSYVLNYVNDKQVFITCCDKSFFDYLQDGKIVQMKGGRLGGEKFQ